MTRMRLELAAGAAVVGLGLFASPASAHNRGEPVDGRWFGVVPCVATTVDPASTHTVCTGSSTWDGTWTGVTRYAYDGTLDVVAGAGQGTIDETFTGRDADGRTGMMRFAEMVVLTPTGIPDTASVRIDATIVGGTGGFRTARGRVVFTGVVNLAGGAGTFSGRSAPPRR